MIRSLEAKAEPMIQCATDVTHVIKNTPVSCILAQDGMFFNYKN